MFEQYNLEQTISQIETNLIDKIEFVIKDEENGKLKADSLIEKVAKKHKIKNFNSSVRRSLGNAIRYGGLPVKVEVYVEKFRRMLVVIKDSGKGFDHQAMLAKFKAGKKYYRRGGSGTKAQSKSKHNKVCWHDGGKTISLLFD